jgi:hypothetical protein
MKTFTWEELSKRNSPKSKLAKEIGIDCPFDTALPQVWLNNFIELSGLDYDKVLYSTFMTYPKDHNYGLIVTAWDEANKWL